jgi:hypothetical protein
MLAGGDLRLGERDGAEGVLVIGGIAASASFSGVLALNRESGFPLKLSRNSLTRRWLYPISSAISCWV